MPASAVRTRSRVGLQGQASTRSPRRARAPPRTPMTVRLRRLATDVRDYVATLPDDTPVLHDAGSCIGPLNLKPLAATLMTPRCFRTSSTRWDSWLELDAPHPDRTLVIEWL